MNFKSILKQLFIPFAILLMAFGTASCSMDKELAPDSSYGYVQFKLYKRGAAPTKALDSLTVANKIRVEVRALDSKDVVAQVLHLHSYNTQTGEYSLRSDKMKLMPGKYAVLRFMLYDKKDGKLNTEDLTADNTFEVVPGGLAIRNLETDAKGRGMVTFRLMNHIASKATDNAPSPFLLSNVRTMDITVENVRTTKTTTLKTVNVHYAEDFKPAPEGVHSDYDGNVIECAYADCDTLLWLETGNYKVNEFVVYSDRKGRTKLSHIQDCPTTFSVREYELTENVPLIVERTEEEEFIKDYIALKQIWEALDGPNWSYFGDTYPEGTNWNFDKEMDLWGNQPGVSLDAKGRVKGLVLCGFGAKGIIPEAIGQLTQLTNFAIGTHSELTGNAHFDFTDVPQEALSYTTCPIGSDYMKTISDQDPRADFTPQLKDAINDNLKPGQSPILERKSSALPNGKVPEYTNHIMGISKAFMRLTKLTSFSIANSPIASLDLVPLEKDSKYASEEDSWSWTQFEDLTDIEIFNCPKLESNPMEMLNGLPHLISFVSAFNYNISGDTFLQNWKDFIAHGLSTEVIQALYLSFNNLEETPTYEELRQMTHLRLLDCANNKLKKIHPFGKEIALAKLFYQNNQLTEVPHVVEDGIARYMGFADVESITFANNRLTELPDIFNANALHIIGSVDFSGNKIDRLENGEAYKGINANIVNLKDNCFKKFPSRIFQAGSPIGFIILSSNGMEEIEEGSLVCDEIYHLTTMDLSFNKLKELSRKDFNATNLPYLQGLDLSYNSFDQVPRAPLNSAYLMILNMRHQRDENGNAILRRWPQGIGKHHGLRRLFLGFNDIRAVNEPVNPDIFIFDIKGNPNITIDLSNVCPLIKAHRYKLFYDRTQDIRGCEVLKEQLL